MNTFRLTIICLVIALVSCQKSEAPATAEQAPPASTAAAQPEAAAPAPAEAAAPAPPSTLPIIATGQSEIAGVRAEIHGLTRGTGEILTLTFSLVNDGTDDLDFSYTFTDPSYSVPDFGGIGGIYLVDPTGMEKLSVMRDPENRCICSRKIRTIAVGKRAQLWAKFPSPAASVEHVSIIIPKFLPIDDVPVGAAASATSADASESRTILAVAHGEIPGQRVEVSQLKRGSGGVVDLRFAIVNDSDQTVSFDYNFADPSHDVADFGGIGGVYLLDPLARDKHAVIRDPENKCACSQSVKDLGSGERVELWAKFPATDTPAKLLSVVVPHFLPLDDVPIE